MCDKIVLTCFNPVTKDLKGSEREPDALGPGYTEIVFEKST